MSSLSIFGQLIENLTYEDYHTRCTLQHALRSSYLKPLMRSPAHLQAMLTEPREETEAFHVGKLIHKLFENPEHFLDSQVVEPEFVGLTKDGKPSTRSAEAKRMREEWRENLPKDKIILTADEAIMISGIWRTLKTKKLVRSMLSKGKSETSLFVEDPETGVMLACRPDFISSHGHVIDIKSTVDAGRDYFVSQIFSNRRHSPFYILQAAHYAHCMQASKIGTGESFVFIALEKTPPYEMNVYPMDAGCLAVGEQWRQKLTKTYLTCMESNHWPGYEDRSMPVFPPAYSEVLDPDTL